MNEYLKTIPLGSEHLTAKPYIPLSSWIAYRLSQYSKSLSHGVQTVSCHVMHRGNAQRNLGSSSALIFERRESYTSLSDAVLTPTSKKEKSHYLNDWLSEMKWLDFNGTVCSPHPGPLGPEGKCVKSAITWPRLQCLMRWERILSQRWASDGQSMAKRRALPAVSILRVHLLFLESQGKWHRQERVLGFKYILVVLLNKGWGENGSSPRCLGNWCPSCISVRH